jgi:hypothetical protein
MNWDEVGAIGQVLGSLAVYYALYPSFDPPCQAGVPQSPRLVPGTARSALHEFR